MSVITKVLSPETQRKRLVEKTPNGPLKDFLSIPFPADKTDCDTVDYVSLDFETTGLNPRKDHIISIGLVNLHGAVIELTTARHFVIKTSIDLPEASIAIHQLTHDEVAQGKDLKEVLDELLPLLAGKVMIAHYAQIEFSFLRAACQSIYHGEFIMPVVDTYIIAKRWLERRQRVYSSGDLRLYNLRDKYNLPQYRAHNALYDALSAAELFTAQVAETTSGKPVPLKHFMARY